MDVTCERCGTEYEFDETLVSDRGTTVKCTNCGHLFKVFRPAADGTGAKSWTVQTDDGRKRTLSSLKELQRLITAGQLQESDLISRGGDEWKRLGDIAELSTFFAVASDANADTEAGGRGRRGTQPGVRQESTRLDGDRDRDVRARATTEPRDNPENRPTHPHSRGGAIPEPGPRRQGGAQTRLGVGGGISEPPPPSAAVTRPPPRHSREPAARPRVQTRPHGKLSSADSDLAATSGAQPSPRPPRPPARPQPRRQEAPRPPAAHAAQTAPARPQAQQAAQQQAAQQATSLSQARDQTPAPAPVSPAHSVQPGVHTPADRNLYLDDEEPVVPIRGGSRSGLWVMLVVVLAAAVATALLWPQIAPYLGLAEEPEDPASPLLASGEEQIARDTVDAYREAVTHYTQALAFDDGSVPALTGLSHAHALWAQALSFEADDLSARAVSDPALAGEANALRGHVSEHAQEALRRAEDAVRRDANVTAEVALADAFRLTDDLSGARRHLERALTIESEPTAETLRVQALTEAAEAEDGDLSAAAVSAGAAVAEDPSMIRARLLYARVLLSQPSPDVASARSQIDAVLRRDARHADALSLRTAIDVGLPPAPATIEVPDGGFPDAGVEETDPETPAVVNDAPTGDAPRRGEPRRDPRRGGAPRGRDYSWYVQRGDEALHSGRTSQAREMFEAARAERPSGSEALTGLGYVALESGSSSEAVSRFRQAAGQGYAEAYIGLGSAYRRQGQNDNALAAYERYLQRLPSGPRASIARRQVEELRRLTSSNDAPPPGGGSAPPPPTDTPPNNDGTLPPPRDIQTPPPQDVPAIDSEP